MSYSVYYGLIEELQSTADAGEQAQHIRPSGSHASPRLPHPGPRRDYAANYLLPPPGTLIQGQEQPWHPQPFLRGSVPNIRQPDGFALVRQEQPPQTPPSLWAGVQGPNVRPPVQDTVLARQEQPPYQAGVLLPSVPNIGRPQSSILGRQEQPPQTPPSLWAGVQGPNVRPPVADAILGRQEQPPYQAGVLLPSVPNIGRPQSSILGRQEQPWHPLPALGSGVQGPNVAAPPQIGGVFARQEQPPQAPSLLVPSVPNIRPLVADWVFARQETPTQTPPVLLAPAPSAVAPAAPPPVVALLQAPQEQPPRQTPVLSAGPQGPDVAPPPHVGAVLGRQEQPWHPSSLLQSSVPSIRPVVADTILGRQEQPWHPQPWVSWMQPSIRPVVADTILVRQEQPPQTPSTLVAPAATPPAAPRTDAVFGRQEQPPQTPPSLWPGRYISPVVNPTPPVTATVLQHQEQPWHPPPLLWPGIYLPIPPPPPPPPPLPYAIGRVAYLLTDVPNLQEVARPRTVLLLGDAPDLPDTPRPRVVLLLADLADLTGVPMPRTVYLQTDTGGVMQLPSLLQYGPEGPLDNDAFTADATAWLAAVAGDAIVSATPAVYLYTGPTTTPAPQTDITVTAVTTQGPLMTVWLSGGVPGNTYVVTWHITTARGRSVYKSVALPIFATRS